MVRLLTADAPFDLPTIYLSWWVERIIAEARALGVEVLSLRGAELTEGNLIAALQSFQPDFVMLGGHGGPNVFTAGNLVPLIIGCQNDEILSGTNVYYISCLTGQQLVPSTVSKNAIGAAGFVSEFVWVVDEPYIPDQDPYARSFERMVVEPALELLKGNGYRGWYNKLQQVSREEEQVWLQSEDPLAAEVVISLRQDSGSATFVSSLEAMPLSIGNLAPLVLAGLILRSL